MKKETEKGDPSEQKLKCYYVMLTQAIHCVQLINDELLQRQRIRRRRRRRGGGQAAADEAKEEAEETPESERR